MIDVLQFIFVFPNKEEYVEVKEVKVNEEVKKKYQLKLPLILHFKTGNDNDRYAFLEENLYLKSTFDKNTKQFTRCPLEYMEKDSQDNSVISCLAELRDGFHTSEKLNFVVPRFICESIRNNLACIGVMLKARKNCKEKLGTLVPKGFEWDRSSFGKNGELGKNKTDNSNPYIMCKNSLADCLYNQIKGKSIEEEMIKEMILEFIKQLKANCKEIMDFTS